MKTQLTLALKLILALFALAFLVNGAYEKMILDQSADAALYVALSALLISCYLDIGKQDKKL